MSIGVFDSGIGGITVFDEILNADNYNEAGKRVSDNVPDFKKESFIYMADQANMPYSNYVERVLLEQVAVLQIFSCYFYVFVATKKPSTKWLIFSVLKKY